MKTYIDAELQVVYLNKNNVIATSNVGVNDDAIDNAGGNAAGRGRFEDWDAGY